MTGPARQPTGDPQAILRAAEAAVRARAAAADAGSLSSEPGGRREGSVATVGDDVPEDVRKALAFVLRSTGQRPQTEAEISAKLRGREHDEATIDAVLRHARAMRALDDEAFAASWVAERGVGRGYGAARLRRELRRRQVPEALIDSALVQLEERDDLTAATELARKRLQQLPASLQPEAVVRRLTAYLLRRGHPPGLAQRVAIDVSGIDRDWD